MPLPKKGVAYTFTLAVYDMAVSGALKANPTIATDDFKVSRDNAAFETLDNLPVVTPTGSVMIQFTLSTAEMNADRISIVGIDQTSPKEWADIHYAFDTTTQTVDDLGTPTVNADALLTRDWTAIVASPAAYSVWNSLRFLRNAWALVAGTPAVLHVKDEAGADAWTRNVTTDAAADPITGVT